jgi:hypothetical protein
VRTASHFEEQLSLARYAADVWADRLRPLYARWPIDPTPEQHWELLIRVALGQEIELPKLSKPRWARERRLRSHPEDAASLAEFLGFGVARCQICEFAS